MRTFLAKASSALLCKHGCGPDCLECEFEREQRRQKRLNDVSLVKDVATTSAL